MKTLMLTACALWLSACGGSSSNPSEAATNPVPLVGEQTPIPPAETLPPINEQTPPLNSQDPAASTQLPSLDPQQPRLSAEASCMALATAVQSHGCSLSDQQATQCLDYVMAGLAASCTAELSKLVTCIIRKVACSQGSASSSDLEASMKKSCPDELAEVANCSSGGNTATGPACSVANNCNCSTLCTTCMCEAQADTSLDCTTHCISN